MPEIQILCLFQSIRNKCLYLLRNQYAGIADDRFCLRCSHAICMKAHTTDHLDQFYIITQPVWNNIFSIVIDIQKQIFWIPPKIITVLSGAERPYLVLFFSRANLVNLCYLSLIFLIDQCLLTFLFLQAFLLQCLFFLLYIPFFCFNLYFKFFIFFICISTKKLFQSA